MQVATMESAARWKMPSPHLEVTCLPPSLPSPTIISPCSLFSGILRDSFSHLDPLFYLHHTFLDRVWWQWQKRSLPARLRDIAGYTTQNKPPTGWVDATLDDELNMFGIIPNATVRDVMDIRGGRLCYDYVDPN